MKSKGFKDEEEATEEKLETGIETKLFRPAAESDFSFRLVLIGMLDGNNGLRLAPLVVMSAHHDVEHPLVPFFFGFDQAERLHVEEVVLHPANLLFAHPAPLQVDGNAGQVRRSRVASHGAALRLCRRSFFCTFTVRTAEFT